MFAGAARRLVANLTVDECLSRRKEGIATELMREIAPVVSGHGRVDDETDMGWGVIKWSAVLEARPPRGLDPSPRRARAHRVIGALARRLFEPARREEDQQHQRGEGERGD